MKDESWGLLPKDEDAPRTDEPLAAVSRKKRLAAAFAVAVVSDILSAWLEFVPPLQWTLDILTAGLLFLMLGRQWVILPALIAEAKPEVVAAETKKVLEAMRGRPGHIFNLGQGLTPGAKLENIAALVDTVKNFK